MIQVLTAQQYREMPWKNGLGVTLEIARSHGEALDDFDWRISIADVKTAGSFSYFLKKQRVLSILEGTGLALKIDHNRPVNILKKEFISFHGECDVYAELLENEIRDFNLIYDHEKFSARVQWVNQASLFSILSNAQQVFVFTHSKTLKIKVKQQEFVLNTFETLHLADEMNILTQLDFESEGGFDFCLIELFSK